MQISTRKIYLLILAVFLSLFAFNSAVFAANDSCQPGDKKSCAAAEACKPAVQGSKIVSTGSSVIDGKCVKDKTANGCYNSNPTSCSGSYSGLKYRDKGAGGNNRPRNHLGSDIGSKGCPNISNINVYAPSDGKVVFLGVGTCSGRSMVIEHENKCSGGKYRTILRHLIAYKKEIEDKVRSGGVFEVKKGDIVGVEGGSNAAGHSTSDICDNPSQSSYPTYTRSGCGKTPKCTGNKPLNHYAIHLHMETVDGGWSASQNSSAGGVKNVMKSYCGGVQALCGGCPIDLSSCGGSTTISSDGTSATMEGLSGGGEGGGADGSYSNDKCSFQEYLNSQDCTFCELFKKFFNIASIMAKVANDKLAGPTKTLVSLGFLIWLCIYLLRHVTSYAKVSTGEMLKGILFQGFRVAVVIIALSGAIYEIMDLTLNPIMETGLEFAKSLNKESTCDSNATYMQNIIGYDETTGFPKPDNASSDKIGGLSKHLGESIVCSLKNLENSTGFLMSLGKYSMCIGWERYPLWKIFPSLGYFTTGALLWLVGLLLLLSFPWCLVDCLLQLCIAVALLPCAVGAFAFKITAQYLKMIWNIFMNSMFQFVFMALIIYIITANLGSWIGYTPGTNPDEKIFITGYSAEGLAWWGIGFFKILIVCLFCWTFFDEAKTMADEFSKGFSIHDLGKKVGGTVASAAFAKGIEPAAQMTGKVVGSSMKKAGRGINNTISRSARNGINNIGYKAIKKLGAEETENADGSTSVSHTFNIMGLKHTRTYTQNEDGTYTLQKTNRRRSNYEKYFKQTTDKDGNTQMRARKSFMGMTLWGMLGKQEMTAHKDEATGRTVWQTANGEGSRQRQIVMDENGNVVEFNKYSNLEDKNIFTQAMHQRSGKEHAPVGYGTRSYGDAVSKTTELLDANGNTAGRITELRNVAPDLIEKNGTTNTASMNFLLQNASDKERIYEAIIVEHMKQRGMNISDKFKERNLTINADNSVSMTQLNNDGRRHEITAKMMGNQMLIEERTFDSQTNIPLYYKKHNGIQSLTEVYNEMSDGTYSIAVQQDFTNYYKQNRTVPLNANGVWGYNIDRDKAMKGFTQQNFDEHVAQLNSNYNTLKFTDLSKEDLLTRMKK